MADFAAGKQHNTKRSASLEQASLHWRAQAITLAFGTFAVGTDAFVIAGVLPSIAASLHVTTGAAGQLVTVFALAYALAAPVLSALTADWSRRTTLVTALAAFTVGNAITALAPGFGLVLGARAIAAAGAGLFTANANATAALFAGSQNRGRAIALVLLGLTSSLVFGAPLGAAIGNAVGWRMTIWVVTGLGIFAGGIIFLRLPEVREGEGTRLAERLAPLRSGAILYDLLRALVVFTGIYIPYTYISVVYSPVTRAAPQWLSLLLFAFGVAGTVGNLLAGRMADRFGPVPAMIFSAMGLIATFLLVPFLNLTVLSAAILASLSGLFSFALNAPQQHFLISHAPGQQTSLVMVTLSVDSLRGGVGFWSAWRLRHPSELGT